MSVLVAVAPAMAQDPAPGQTPPAADSTAATRADLLRQQREAKARNLQPPPHPGVLSHAWQFIEASYGPKSAQWAGVAPWFGSVISGGGFAVGARYRNTLLFDRRASFELHVRGSIKRYYQADARFGGRRIGGTPLFANVFGTVREYPQEDFFGLGRESLRDNRTNFLYRDVQAGVRAGVDVVAGVSLGAELRFLDPAVGRGRDSLYPSIEERFTDIEAPGLSSQPNFVMTSFFAEIDRVGSPESARTGGGVRFVFTNASDRDSGVFSYRQMDIDARHYVPFFQGKRLFVVRGVLSTTDTDEGHTVPFYMQHILGSRRTLRGYDDGRFRGPQLLLFQAEYRFEVWPALDMAVFFDAGKVEQRRADLNLSGLKRDYGVSFRFGGENAFFRIDMAYGGETRRYSVAFGDVF
jgi:hypothetical protein